MRNIFLAAYSIVVHEKWKPEQSISLISDKKTTIPNILEYCSQYLDNIKAKHIEVHAIRRTLTVEKKNIDANKSMVSGIVHAGEYGFISSGYNIKKQTNSYTRTVDDSDEIPFYFCFYIQKDAKRGILILERFGNTGVRKPLTNPLIDKFNNEFPDYKMKINPLAIADVLAEFLKSDYCTEITLIQSTMPSDYAQKIRWYRTVQKGKKKSKEQCGTLELTIKANRNWRILGLKKSINDIQRKDLPISSLIELPNFEYDNAAVTLESNGRKKKFLLSKDNHARTFLDITDKCKRQGGHPIYEDVHKEAVELITELNNIL